MEAFRSELEKPPILQVSNLRYVYQISMVAALGGLLFGYDTAVISGAICSISTKFGLTRALEGWAASSAIWGCVAGEQSWSQSP